MISCFSLFGFQIVSQAISVHFITSWVSAQDWVSNYVFEFSHFLTVKLHLPMVVSFFSSKNQSLDLLDSTVLNHVLNPLPIEYIDANLLPNAFSWDDLDGKSYTSHMLNQHIPQ